MTDTPHRDLPGQAKPSAFADDKPQVADSRELFRVEGLPVQQNTMYRSVEAALHCPRGDVVLVQDNQSGLISNRAFDPSLLTYDQDYQNEQGVSRFFKQHLEAVADILQPHAVGKALLEIGCGKGLFLELLHQRGLNIRGMDPTYEGDSPLITKEFFGGNVTTPSDGIILRHVLEHIPNPLKFIDAIRLANRNQGWIYIEVPCFDWICRTRTWFDVFYEHVNYFRLDDFRRFFTEVHYASHSFGGQYLSFLAELRSFNPTPASPVIPVKMPGDFTASIDNLVRRLAANAATSQSPSSPKTVVWGAASKGVIFSLFMRRAGITIDHVIDINPAKQGRFLAATGIQVMAPEAVLPKLPAGSRIIVMNANYAEEIRQQAGPAFEYLLAEHG